MDTKKSADLLWLQAWHVECLHKVELPSLPRVRAVRRHVVPPCRVYDSRLLSMDAPFYKHTLSGGGELTRVDGRAVALPSGTGFLHVPGNGDSFRLPEGAEEPWDWLHINFMGVERLFAEIIDAYGPVFRLGSEPPLLEPFLTMGRQGEFNTSLWLDPGESARMAMGFATGLLAMAAAKAPPREGALADKARTLIHERLLERPQVKGIAKEIGVSPEHLIRSFKAATGRTPQAYYAEELARHAQRLLRESALPVKQVAGELGFASVSHFCSFFRRLCGRSPAEWRVSDAALSETALHGASGGCWCPPIASEMRERPGLRRKARGHSQF